MSRGPIRIVNYDPQWPEFYRDYATDIVRVLDGQISKVAHVGSTSIQGLGAKPTIDISITVKDINAEQIIEQMRNLGYNYNSSYEKEMPFRRYFVMKEGDKHLVHVHIVPINNQFHRDMIVFRNYLRKYRDIRDEYHLLKTRLANKYKENRTGYQEAKSEFIQNMLEMAKEELVDVPGP